MQFAKARDPIDFNTPVQNTVLRFVHPSKALFLIFFTPPCKYTITISVRSLNAFSPISLYSDGTVSTPSTSGGKAAARRAVSVHTPLSVPTLNDLALSQTKQVSVPSALLVPQIVHIQGITFRPLYTIHGSAMSNTAKAISAIEIPNVIVSFPFKWRIERIPPTTAYTAHQR